MQSALKMPQNFWFFIAPYKKACTCSMFIYFSYIHAVFSKVISMHSCSFQVHSTFCTCTLQLSHSFYFSSRIYVIISMPLCNLKLCVYRSKPNIQIQILICCPHMLSIEVVGTLSWSLKMFCDHVSNSQDHSIL